MFMNIMVSPLVAAEITVFITISFGWFNSSRYAICLPAPPFMNRQLMKITRVPATTKVKF
jgi:hypothetical protein